MKVTLLGTGTSTGVPMIGCQCRTCLSTDPRDKRLRVSALLQTEETTFLIDTSADFRQQMLRMGIRHIDGIAYTHHHYDHISGFDDLRAFQFLYRKAPQCYATSETIEVIQRTFAYAFGLAPQAGGGLPQVPFATIDTEPFEVNEMKVTPIPIEHGKLSMLGYRVGDFAYLTDCSSIPESSLDLLKNLDVLVLDGLRYASHPTHFSIDQAVEQAQLIAPRRTYLTHMNHDILHAEAESKLPENIFLGYDGLALEVSL